MSSSEQSNPWDKLKCVKCCNKLSNLHFILFNKQKYHDECFTCAQCKSQITERQYSLNQAKEPICLNCFEANKYENSKFCHKCSLKIVDGPVVTANNKHYHPNCFTCIICNQLIDGKCIFDECDNVGHPDCLIEKKFCHACQKSLEFNQQYAKQGDKLWHKECFKCKCCQKTIPTNHPFYPTGESDEVAICIDCGEITIEKHL